MAFWEFLMSGWVLGLYGALRSQGVGGCLLAAAAGWQAACWGLRLTGHEVWGWMHRADAGPTDWQGRVAGQRWGARSWRWLGLLLQATGALLMAIALVALARTVVNG